MKKLLFLLALLGLGGGVALWQMGYIDFGPAPVEYKFERVRRGEILATVGATGTLEPEEVVDVSAQVTGKVVEFGKDPHSAGRHVNYGSKVEAGTLLARIDDSLYKARFDQASAALKKAAADLESSQAKARQYAAEWARAQKLRHSPDAIAQADFETARFNHEGGGAGVHQAEAALEVARANLAEAKANLGYCTITSPVKGVIIDRRVNVGQTVVASLNAPSMFLIATDLSRMEVWASVNEADVGHVQPGQPVTFKVAAFPDKRYPGKVSLVRLNATSTSSVVIYTVVVSFQNPHDELLPYMTANLQFEVSRRPDVLKLPNSVLRWRPPRDQVREDFRPLYDDYQGRRGAPSGGEQPRALLWRQEGRWLCPVEVRVGLTDGTDTEIISDGLSEGDSIVSGVQRKPTGGGNSGNSLIPTVNKRKPF
jgi:HlyD family secretion protein